MGLFDDLDDIHEAGIEKIDKVIDKEAKRIADGVLDKFLSDDDLTMEEIVAATMNIRGIDTQTLKGNQQQLEKLAAEAREDEAKRRKNLELMGDIIGSALRKGVSAGIA
jgi:hypothetical protein